MTLELTTHREGGQVHLFASDGADHGHGFGLTAAVREACFSARRNGFERVRIDGGESFDAAQKILEIDDALFASRPRRGRK